MTVRKNGKNKLFWHSRMMKKPGVMAETLIWSACLDGSDSKYCTIIHEEFHFKTSQRRTFATLKYCKKVPVVVRCYLKEWGRTHFASVLLSTNPMKSIHPVKYCVSIKSWFFFSPSATYLNCFPKYIKNTSMSCKAT